MNRHVRITAGLRRGTGRLGAQGDAQASSAQLRFTRIQRIDIQRLDGGQFGNDLRHLNQCVLQGFGGGGLMVLSQALLAEHVPRHQLGRAQGFMAAVIVASSTFGPVAGGTLTQAFGWPSVFLVNLPLGFFAMLLAMRLLGIAAQLSPLILCTALGWRGARATGDQRARLALAHGWLIAAVDLLRRKPQPGDDDIDQLPNLCRCGCQTRVRRAIKRVAAGKAGQP